ncbi:hypothetical protein Tco_1359701 [Tanacetum coccineum]
MTRTSVLHSRESAAADSRKGYSNNSSRRTTQETIQPPEYIATTATQQSEGPEGAGDDKYTPLTMNPKGDTRNREAQYTPKTTSNASHPEEQLVGNVILSIKEGKDKQRGGGKKDAPRDKADTIYMVQSWQRKTKQKHSNQSDKLKSHDFIPDYPEQEVSIGGSLSDTGRAAVCALLQRNLDIFAWEPKHMTGVPRSITEHRLKIRQGYSPVRQKKRGQAPERAKAILEEVHKLVEAGIMREVYYHDWLSNPVMVKKSDGSWRMCVDFTDLNKACPQDCYPLPEIDWKVESLCGYPFKCFLDAYKGYHQIQMAKDDEEKTAFHTSQERLLCYTKMPFGLNNAGANLSSDWVITRSDGTSGPQPGSQC